MKSSQQIPFKFTNTCTIVYTLYTLTKCKEYIFNIQANKCNKTFSPNCNNLSLW